MAVQNSNIFLLICDLSKLLTSTIFLSVTVMINLKVDSVRIKSFIFYRKEKNASMVIIYRKKLISVFEKFFNNFLNYSLFIFQKIYELKEL